MSFFSDLHRSIFDPYFYREAMKRSRGSVFLFLLKLLIFTAVIICFSKTYYLVHSERGIAPLVSAMFGDMEIQNGRLVTEREQPYSMPGAMLTELMNRLVGYPRFFSNVPDGFLVVDTRTPPIVYDAITGPKIIFKASGVEFLEMRMNFPYKIFIGGEDFQFTASAIQGVLNKNIASFAICFLTSNLLFGFFTMMLSVFFLSLAAYIFSADRGGGYKHFVRLACYSIPPVTLGDALVSLSGVSVDWTWHIFIVISTVLMFRAMTRASSDRASANKSEVL